MQSGKFNCKQCSAVCCNSPPQLSGLDEVMKAVELDSHIELFAVHGADDLYFVGIPKLDGKCPFKRGGGCSIYERRFDACEGYNCVAVGKPISSLTTPNDESTLSLLTINTKPLKKPLPVSGDTIARLKIPIVSVEKAIQLTSVFEYKTIMSEIVELKQSLVGDNHGF